LNFAVSDSPWEQFRNLLILVVKRLFSHSKAPLCAFDLQWILILSRCVTTVKDLDRIVEEETIHYVLHSDELLLVDLLIFDDVDHLVLYEQFCVLILKVVWSIFRVDSWTHN
jgi:hypothetical protein